MSTAARNKGVPVENKKQSLAVAGMATVVAAILFVLVYLAPVAALTPPAGQAAALSGSSPLASAGNRAYLPLVTRVRPGTEMVYTIPPVDFWTYQSYAPTLAQASAGTDVACFTQCPNLDRYGGLAATQEPTARHPGKWVVMRMLVLFDVSVVPANLEVDRVFFTEGINGTWLQVLSGTLHAGTWDAYAPSAWNKFDPDPLLVIPPSAITTTFSMPVSSWQAIRQAGGKVLIKTSELPLDWSDALSLVKESHYGKKTRIEVHGWLPPQ